MRIHKDTFAGNLRRHPVSSPVGLLTIVVSAAGIRALIWEGEDSAAGVQLLTESDHAHRLVVQAAQQQLDEYFLGERTAFRLGLDLVGTLFQLQAWQTLRAIPFGGTVSYAQQARQLGSAQLARAVGGANRRNPVSIIVPCHRVIGVSGALTGFAGGMGVKSALLAHEQQVLLRCPSVQQSR